MVRYTPRFPREGCFVKVFDGFDTAGNPIFKLTCICPECLRRTTPIHTPPPEEDKDE